MNYEADVAIDESALDIEWLRQPNLMLEYALHCANKRKEMDLCKEEVELVRSQLDKELREAMTIDGKKPTETAIQNAIVLQQPYQEAVRRYIEAKYEFEVASAAVRAIETKKAALENLVKLHGQQYFAGPKVPRDLRKEWENVKDKLVSKRIADKLRT